MSTQTQTQLMDSAPTGTAPPAVTGFHVSDRLRECSAKLREHVRGPLASRWLKDNYSLLQSQITDLRHALRPSFLRKLPRTSEGEPRIHRIAAAWLAGIAADWLATAPGVVDSDVLMPFAHNLRENHSLDILELWAFAPMLKLATIERLCANLEVAAFAPSGRWKPFPGRLSSKRPPARKPCCAEIRRGCIRGWISSRVNDTGWS